MREFLFKEGKVNETEKPKGLSSEGQTSEGETQGTSKKEPKTYTEEELNKAKNDALAAAGRDAKSLAEREANLKTLEESLKERQSQIDEILRQRDEAELTEAKSDPEKMREYQLKRHVKDQLASLETEKANLKKQRADFEREKAEHAETVKAAQEARLDIAIWEIGAEFGIDPTVLKDGVKDLNITTEDGARALAKRISDSLPKRPAEEKFIPDSGVTSGGGKLTDEQLDKLPMTDYADHRKKEDPRIKI
jgi:hypothetical protein